MARVDLRLWRTVVNDGQVDFYHATQLLKRAGFCYRTGPFQEVFRFFCWQLLGFTILGVFLTGKVLGMFVFWQKIPAAELLGPGVLLRV